MTSKEFFPLKERYPDNVIEMMERHSLDGSQHNIIVRYHKALKLSESSGGGNGDTINGLKDKIKELRAKIKKLENRLFNA